MYLVHAPTLLMHGYFTTKEGIPSAIKVLNARERKLK